MDGYKKWIMSLCFLSLFMWVVYNVLPESGNKKFLRIALSLMFVAVAVQPIYNSDFSEIFDTGDLFCEKFNTEDILSESSYITADYMEDMIFDNLNVECECVIECEYSSDNVNIHSIEITVNNESEGEKVKNFIKENTGVAPEIKVKNK